MSQIPVSKTILPDIDELQYYLQRIYAHQQTTNNGPLVREFECKLKDYLGVKHLFLTGNATIGLQIAMHALSMEGKEVLTSAFSYVAAPSAIISSNARPMFVDVNAKDYCINVDEVESLINENTGAIFPTHVFNTVCDVRRLADISQKYGVPIVYDAAHSFGIMFNNESIFNYGDISVCSLHALKVFNSVEGGFIVTSNDELAEKIYETRYFGANRENVGFSRVGFNGKNSEIHAAFGLANMGKVDEILKERHGLYKLYQDILVDLPLQWQQICNDIRSNYSYLPLIFESELIREIVEKALTSADISFRRYFQPALNKLHFYNDVRPMPIAESISDRILCLPLYNGLTFTEVEKICNVLLQVYKWIK